jgi:hypothetical protein
MKQKDARRKEGTGWGMDSDEKGVTKLASFELERRRGFGVHVAVLGRVEEREGCGDGRGRRE